MFLRCPSVTKHRPLEDMGTEEGMFMSIRVEMSMSMGMGVTIVGIGAWVLRDSAHGIQCGKLHMTLGCHDCSATHTPASNPHIPHTYAEHAQPYAHPALYRIQAHVPCEHISPASIYALHLPIQQPLATHGTTTAPWPHTLGHTWNHHCPLATYTWSHHCPMTAFDHPRVTATCPSMQSA